MLKNHGSETMSLVAKFGAFRTEKAGDHLLGYVENQVPSSSDVQTLV